MSLRLPVFVAAALLSAATADALPSAGVSRCAAAGGFASKTSNCTALWVASGQVAKAHRTAPNPQVVVVRRGYGVRLTAQVQSPTTCASPSLVLSDLFSGADLPVPLLSREAGLALAWVNSQALAANDPQRAAQLTADVAATLGVDIQGEVLPTPAAAKYDLAVRSHGTPLFAAKLATALASKQGPATVDIGLWLPETLPAGAYALTPTCNGVADGPALPMVVLFNPYAAATAEYAGDPQQAAALLDSTATKASAGPLQFEFAAGGDANVALEAALRSISGLPASMRAEPALVAQALSGAHQAWNAAAEAPGYFKKAAGVILFDVSVWNDASGHFDLWDGGAKIAWDIRPNYLALFAKDAGHEGIGAKKIMPGAGNGASPASLLAKFTFDDGRGIDSAPGQAGLVVVQLTAADLWPAAEVPVPFKPDPVAQLEAARVGASKVDTPFVHGETPCDVKSCGPTAPGEWSSSAQLLQYALAGGQARVRYGQCWVFSGTLTSMARAVGIPTRPVSNFDSAHEKSADGAAPGNRGLAVVRDAEVRAGGDEPGAAIWNFHVWVETLGLPKEGPTSVWNFHVWNEAMLKSTGGAVWNFHVWNEALVRRAQGQAPTWNAYDSTPQELSSPVYTGKPPAYALAALKFAAPSILVDAVKGVWTAPLQAP